MTKWRVLPDSDAIAREAAGYIGAAAQRAIAARGTFSLVLAGGRTPRRTYARLAGSDQDWPAWSLYYGDERCLPPGHPERNSHGVEASGLADRVGSHHPIPAELGPESAALAYSAVVTAALPFDLVLLGMGQDGHTASLFPGRTWPQEALVIAVHDAPKPPPERVSLTPAALQSCREMLVLVTGAEKRQAVHAWRSGACLPVAEVSALPQSLVLVEQALLEDPQ